MNMMKTANNTTKTKLLTLVCKELRDGNENIAITNHMPPPWPRGAGMWVLLRSIKTLQDAGWDIHIGAVSPPGPLPILPALKEERGEKRKASKVLNPTRISLPEGCPFFSLSLRVEGEWSGC